MIHPKVFISYSWHPESNKIKVQELAERLTNDGVQVIIDIWDLHDGQDKNVFMEKMVNDPEISKVLLICNKEYTTKANLRKGGVGIESTIVSSEVYNKADKTKFIPVIFEKDHNGNAYCPTYVKSRTYIDLSEDEKIEVGYDKLLRDIYGKPISKRPTLGEMPEYLKDETPSVTPTSNKLRALKHSLEGNEKFIKAHVKDYQKTFLSSLIDYQLDWHALHQNNIVSEVENSIEKMQPLVNDFIDFLEIVINYDICDSSFFINFFESLLQFYKDNDIELLTDRNICNMANDNYRYINYQLFLAYVTVMMNSEKYVELANVLDSIFLINQNNSRLPIDKCDFSSFQEYNYTLDDFKNNNLRRVSVVADMMKRHSVKLQFSDLVNNDLLLYYLSYLYDYSKDTYSHHWYPSLSAYNHNREILPKLISKRYFNQIKGLSGVNNVEEFKERINSIKDPRDKYIDGYHHIPTMKDGLCFETVATIN